MGCCYSSTAKNRGSPTQHSKSFSPVNLQTGEKIKIRLKTDKVISDPNDPENRYYRKQLLNQSFSNLEKFTFSGILTQAKVIDVYDGDTITIVFYYNQQPIKDSFRLFGCDAPERKPKKDAKYRELEIQAANVVKSKVEQLILNQIIWVKFMEEEKYGRLMGDVYLISKDSEQKFTGNELHLNQWLIQKGYAKSYQGGHKEEFTQQELSKICQ